MSAVSKAAWTEPTSSAGASTVALVVASAQLNELSPELPATESATSSTTPAPTVLAKGLIRTMMVHLRLDEDQRCNAVKKWHAESALGVANVDNQVTAAESRGAISLRRWWRSSP